METNMVYVTALQDSLSKKQNILSQLLELTLEQNRILKQELTQKHSDASPQASPQMERFEEIVWQKETLLGEMSKLDSGFESLYAKIGNELKEHKYQYQSQILQIQNLIRGIMDIGTRLEGVEQKNKEAFQEYLIGARREIKNFKKSNKTAVSYYQNMANQHHAWQTYFMDQKK